MATNVRTATIPDTGRTFGVVCVAGAAVGAAQGIAVLLWPAAVGLERYSYPFGPTGYTVAQLSFALQHLLLLAGLVALRRLPWSSRSRTGRAAASTAVVGMVLLAVVEVVAVAAAHEPVSSARAGLVNGLYGIPTVLLGVSLVVLGVVGLRSPRDERAGAPWLPAAVVALGAYVFVVLIPTLSGSFTAARLGVTGWMLLFGALGAGLTQAHPTPR